MFPFEQLLVYQKAVHFNKIIYRFLRDHKSLPTYLKNQLGRASLSITLNIAQGSAKEGLKDRKRYFSIARGSVFECCAIVLFLKDENEIICDLGEELIFILNEISRMLFVLIKNLEARMLGC